MLLTNSNLNYNEMRKIVLNYVLNNEFNQFGGILSGIASDLISRGICKETNSYSMSHSSDYKDLAEEDANLVNEIVWDLILERVLAIGLNKANPAWPFLRLTSYGKSFRGNVETVCIHDVTGMLNLLDKNVASCDSVIKVYFGECLNTYCINSLLSSSVMLGCAAEKLICILFSSYVNWLRRANQKEHDNLLKFESRNISRKFDELVKSMKAHKDDISVNDMDDFDLIVSSLFSIIRQNRNDAGHPTGKAINRDELQTMIYVFINYCKKVYSFIEFFDSSSSINVRE